MLQIHANARETHLNINAFCIWKLQFILRGTVCKLGVYPRLHDGRGRRNPGFRPTLGCTGGPETARCIPWYFPTWIPHLERATSTARQVMYPDLCYYSHSRVCRPSLSFSKECFVYSKSTSGRVASFQTYRPQRSLVDSAASATTFFYHSN